jgi:hypothetical protein
VKAQINHTNALTNTVMDAVYVTNQKQHYNAVLYSNENTRGTALPTDQKRDCNIVLPKWLQTPGVRCMALMETKGKSYGGIGHSLTQGPAAWRGDNMTYRYRHFGSQALSVQYGRA